MIGDISGAGAIYIVCGYTDMRKSVLGLCSVIKEKLETEVESHTIYLFCGKRCDRIKILMKEPDGFVLIYTLLLRAYHLKILLVLLQGEFYILPLRGELSNFLI